MEEAPVPFERTVFVCTNVRANGRIACANPGRGGDRLCEALKEGVKRLGLKARVRVASSGCLDLCSRGPNLFIYPEGVWLSGARPEDAPEILKKLLSPAGS